MKKIIKRNQLKISAKLILFFIVFILLQGILSLGLVTILFSRSNRDSFQAQMDRSLVGIEQYLEQTITDLNIKAELFSGQEKVIDYTEYGLTNLLKRELQILKGSLAIHGIGIFLESGKILTHTGNLPQISTRVDSYLKKDSDTKSYFFVADTEDEIFLVVLSSIFRGDNQMIGVISLYQKIDEQFLKRVEKITNSQVVISYHQKIIYNTNDPVDYSAIFKDNNFFLEKSRKTQQIGQSIVSYIPTSVLGEPEGKIICFIDTGEAIQLIKRYNQISVLVTLIILSLALFIGLLFYRATFHRPFQNLLTGIKNISSGMLKQKIPESGNDEFSDLARAFNQMRLNLINREEEISQLSNY
ncbi:MAG: HAMP domain-containing protein, partial [Spirochaetes bacterium]|nr:HAMP domain-containing protein [Spirochaetota bacterium]